MPREGVKSGLPCASPAFASYWAAWTSPCVARRRLSERNSIGLGTPFRSCARRCVCGDLAHDSPHPQAHSDAFGAHKRRPVKKKLANRLRAFGQACRCSSPMDNLIVGTLMNPIRPHHPPPSSGCRTLPVGLGVGAAYGPLWLSIGPEQTHAVVTLAMHPRSCERRFPAW